MPKIGNGIEGKRGCIDLRLRSSFITSVPICSDRGIPLTRWFIFGSGGVYHLGSDVETAVQKLRDVVLQAAGGDRLLKEIVVGPLIIDLWKQNSTWNCIAAFAGDMLLGTDFLSQLRATFHLNNPMFTLGEEDIPLWNENFPGGSRVARVYVHNRKIVQPFAVRTITGVVDQLLFFFLNENEDAGWVNCLHEYL